MVTAETRVLPILPTRDVVVFPHSMTVFEVDQRLGLRAVEEALANDRFILLTAHLDQHAREPQIGDLFSVGTIALVDRSTIQPDGKIKVLVEAVERGKIISATEEKGLWSGSVQTFHYPVEPGGSNEALISTVLQLFARFIELKQSLNRHAMLAAVRTDDPGKLADLIIPNMCLKPALERKQQLLEIFDPVARLTRVAETLDAEIENLSICKRTTISS